MCFLDWQISSCQFTILLLRAQKKKKDSFVTFRGRRHKPLMLPQVSQSLYLKPSVTLSTTSFPLYHYLFPFLRSSFLSVQTHNNKTQVWLYVPVGFSQMPTSLIWNISSSCVTQPYTLLSIIWTRYRDNIFT